MAQAVAQSETKAADVNRRDNIPYKLGKEYGYRGAIGLIVLAVDSTMEQEFRQILPQEGIALYANRIPFSNQVTRETLAALESDIVKSAELIHPGRRLDVLAFGCTSGTIVIGKDKVFAKLREVRPDIACTTPMVAGVEGCKALGIRRLALLTPYIEEINRMVREFIENHGLEVPVMGSFNNPNDDEVARIAPESLRDAILDLGREDVEAVFVSCSSLQVTPVIEECEAKLGKPVMSSNQAMAWHSLRLAGYTDPIPSFGRLLRV